MNARLALVVAVVALTSACAPKKIPGTNIDDTDDTRGIVDVIESYRVAFEKKDVASMKALLDETFRDDGGTNSPDDDLEYRTFEAKFSEMMGNFDNPRLELSVRKIDFDDDHMKARAVYTWNSTFRMPKLTPRPFNDGEIKQMSFKRLDKKKKGTWRIVSGI